MTRQELIQATRAELVAYLESWGFACWAWESTEDLRTAALLNLETEGE